MSFLTKVFVVLVAVLSVLLLALLVPLVANQQNYKAEIQREVQKRLAAEETARNKAMEVSILANSQEKVAQAAQNQIDSLHQLVTAQAQERAFAEANAVKAQNDADRLAATANTAADNVRQLTVLLEAADKELAFRRDEMVKLQGNLTETAAKLSEARNGVELQERLIRQLKEQQTQLTVEYNDLKDKLAQLPKDLYDRVMGKGGANVAGGGADVVPAPVVIRGQVLATSQANNQIFASISVGKSDGVREGMKFLVSRGNQFLGNLHIIRVDDNTAAGELSLPQGPINKGDKVEAGPGI